VAAVMGGTGPDDAGAEQLMILPSPPALAAGDAKVSRERSGVGRKVAAGGGVDDRAAVQDHRAGGDR